MVAMPSKSLSFLNHFALSYTMDDPFRQP